MKYAWIKAQEQFPITAMCRVLGVSKSGYYKSQSAKVSPRRQRTQRIHDDVQTLYDRSHQIYGSYKIADQLQKDKTMESACRNTVAIVPFDNAGRSFMYRIRPSRFRKESSRRDCRLAGSCRRRHRAREECFVPLSLGYVTRLSHKVAGDASSLSVVAAIDGAADDETDFVAGDVDR